ncbi:MAG: hypothetical protein RBS96_07570 [Dehalococcoidales bacterium]|nr:hypothetical protein [Dehalococcoidales bacterium]
MEAREERIGEVIEASTGIYSAQSYQLYELPALGEMIKCRQGETEIMAVTCNGSTTSLEPGRRPIARGLEESSEEELYRNNPQLNQLLRSEFDAVVVGYKQGDAYHQYLPPRPVRLHSFVYRCSTEEIVEFSQSLEFLVLLAGAQCEVPVEELVSACLRILGGYHGEEADFNTRAGRKLAEMYSGDYQRLRAILARLK